MACQPGKPQSLRILIETENFNAVLQLTIYDTSSPENDIENKNKCCSKHTVLCRTGFVITDEGEYFSCLELFSLIEQINYALVSLKKLKHFFYLNGKNRTFHKILLQIKILRNFLLPINILRVHTDYLITL